LLLVENEDEVSRVDKSARPLQRNERVAKFYGQARWVFEAIDFEAGRQVARHMYRRIANSRTCVVEGELEYGLAFVFREVHVL